MEKPFCDNVGLALKESRVEGKSRVDTQNVRVVSTALNGQVSGDVWEKVKGREEKKEEARSTLRSKHPE